MGGEFGRDVILWCRGGLPGWNLGWYILTVGRDILLRGRGVSRTSSGRGYGAGGRIGRGSEARTGGRGGLLLGRGVSPGVLERHRATVGKMSVDTETLRGRGEVVRRRWCGPMKKPTGATFLAARGTAWGTIHQSLVGLLILLSPTEGNVGLAVTFFFVFGFTQRLQGHIFRHLWKDILLELAVCSESVLFVWVLLVLGSGHGTKGTFATTLFGSHRNLGLVDVRNTDVVAGVRLPGGKREETEFLREGNRDRRKGKKKVLKSIHGNLNCIVLHQYLYTKGSSHLDVYMEGFFLSL